MSSQRHFYLDGSGDYLTTPDAAGFSGLGDFSVVARVNATDWTPGTAIGIASHYAGTTNRSWRLLLQPTTGVLRLVLSTNGSTITQNDSTSAPSFSDGTTYWVLITRASSSGDVKFYTAADNGSNTPPSIGSFSQLGSTVTTTTGTLFNSTDTFYVGAVSGGTNAWAGSIYRVTVYSGIYGSGSESRVADMLADDYSSGTTFTAATTGETWTLVGNTRGDIEVTPDASASATATANNAAASVKPNASAASATGTANNATTSVAPSPGAASATATANNAAASVAATAGTASATGTANSAAGSVAPSPGAASATATANNAAPVSGTFASAGTASGTGTANDAAGSVAASAGVASATATANDATVTADGVVTPTTEEPRFGGAPVSKRDLDRMEWERQLERLLREDEEILCLV